MKRCINCNKLLAQDNRDVCLDCLRQALKEDKSAIVKIKKEVK